VASHLIKRYPNRKLYDTESRRYITLATVAELVRAGHEVTVVDRQSGNDITSTTLAAAAGGHTQSNNHKGGGIVDLIHRSISLPLSLSQRTVASIMDVRELQARVERLERQVSRLTQQSKER
jgi:NAD(P)-dependent dehydrogenase (short-subunit alcohol dehydrogenase family)